jgi:hypothetical protein
MTDPAIHTLSTTDAAPDDPRPSAVSRAAALPAVMLFGPAYVGLEAWATAARSAAIAARGAGTLNAASFGILTTMLDDAVLMHRARRSCRSLGSRLALERDLAPRTVGRSLCRTIMLLRILVQLYEEAAEPVQRRVSIAAEILIFGTSR